MPIQHPAHLPWWQYQVIDTEQRSQSQGPSQRDPGVTKDMVMVFLGSMRFCIPRSGYASLEACANL